MNRRNFLRTIAASVFAAPFFGIAKAAGVDLQWVRQGDYWIAQSNGRIWMMRAKPYVVQQQWFMSAVQDPTDWDYRW